MTVGSQIKTTYFMIKSARATLEQLQLNASSKDAQDIYRHAKKELKDVQIDLQRQLKFLANEEPQYK